MHLAKLVTVNYFYKQKYDYKSGIKYYFWRMIYKSCDLCLIYFNMTGKVWK